MQSPFDRAASQPERSSPARLQPQRSDAVRLDLDLRQRFARPVSGPSYRTSFRVVTMALLVALAAYGAQVLRAATAWSAGLAWLAATAALVLLASAWPVLFGKTTVDAQGIRRTGPSRGALGWDQIGRARYLRLPLAPRLLVLPTAGPMRTFHAGNVALEQAFADIERFYRDAR